MAAELPAGWKREFIPGYEHCEVFTAPEGAGMVTVDYEKRGFRLGYVPAGPVLCAWVYKGAGWRERLVADALATLKRVLKDFGEVPQ